MIEEYALPPPGNMSQIVPGRDQEDSRPEQI